MKRLLLKLFRTLPKNADELRKLGAVVGGGFCNYGTIDTNHCNLLTIGNNVTIASGAKIELHDASTKRILGYSKIGRVEIGNNVFVGANSIILPNVKIGSDVVIGAGSVVVKDIPSNSVAVGNPCRVISTYDDYIEKSKKLYRESKVYQKQYEQMCVEEKMAQRSELIDGGFGFDL